LVAVVAGAVAGVEVVVGVASQYAPGVMRRVGETRQGGAVACPLPRDLPVVDGFVAVRDCGRIGEVWSVRPVGGDWPWERFLVADCAGDEATWRWMAEGNIVLEVVRGRNNEFRD